MSSWTKKNQNILTTGPLTRFPLKTTTSECLLRVHNYYNNFLQYVTNINASNILIIKI